MSRDPVLAWLEAAIAAAPPGQGAKTAKYHRVVKPRTAKQRAAAQAYGARSGVFLNPKDVGLPTDSWWVGKDRSEFSAAAHEQRERLAQSRFARVGDPTYNV